MSELERRTHDMAGNEYGKLTPTPPSKTPCPACNGSKVVICKHGLKLECFDCHGTGYLNSTGDNASPESPRQSGYGGETANTHHDLPLKDAYDKDAGDVTHKKLDGVDGYLGDDIPVNQPSKTSDELSEIKSTLLAFRGWVRDEDADEHLDSSIERIQSLLQQARIDELKLAGYGPDDNGEFWYIDFHQTEVEEYWNERMAQLTRINNPQEDTQ